MKTDDRFKFYGQYDVTNLKKILETPALNWDEYTDRQRACTDMTNTKTIPIIFEDDFFSTNFYPVKRKNFPIFEKELDNIIDSIKTELSPNGYLLRALFVKLLRKTKIPTHVDKANKTFQFSNRIHIPIVTNPNCIFTVGDESIHMKEGEIWEINNDKQPHSVINDGDEDRIHLIFDWCEKPLN